MFTFGNRSTPSFVNTKAQSNAIAQKKTVIVIGRRMLNELIDTEIHSPVQ